MFDTESIIGHAAGASSVEIRRSAGRAPPNSSRSYLARVDERNRQYLLWRDRPVKQLADYFRPAPSLRLDTLLSIGLQAYQACEFPEYEAIMVGNPFLGDEIATALFKMHEGGLWAELLGLGWVFNAYGGDGRVEPIIYSITGAHLSQLFHVTGDV